MGLRRPLPDCLILEGEAVTVWADGADVGTETDFTQLYTVAGGQIVLAAPVTNAIVGLPYTSQWQSTKLMANEVNAAIGSEKAGRPSGLVFNWVSPKG